MAHIYIYMMLLSVLVSAKVQAEEHMKPLPYTLKGSHHSEDGKKYILLNATKLQENSLEEKNMIEHYNYYPPPAVAATPYIPAQHMNMFQHGLATNSPILLFTVNLAIIIYALLSLIALLNNNNNNNNNNNCTDGHMNLYEHNSNAFHQLNAGYNWYRKAAPLDMKI